ncbi:NAD(P)H-dependent oxidoreductase subunit E [Chitinasiproducens palmae]|uniref:Formate dehydrogenase gamma subunit n=1 Tax=Chitinasiproducens palmae TaxID=1770053 RepID=A0A1H2PJN4_9BURK|nr:NAD(P)H-dependent oxidoreductase subunit E [Chitinasiproducens palmae]SDV46121.1 formate dehydrogenase gamma subunit [Chitinasiproducens palmae]
MRRDPTPAYDAVVAGHVRPGRSLLAVLHAVQDDFGYVPDATLASIARAMHLSRAEVYGVLTYYHHFRCQPPARLTIALCRAESCRSMGGEALVAHAEAVTGCKIDAHLHEAVGEAVGEGAEHGDVALESVYCLGQCGQSPAATIDGKVRARLDTARFDRLLAAARAVQAGERDGLRTTSEGEQA